MLSRFGLPATAVYHLLAGLLLFFAPSLLLRWVGFPPEAYHYSLHILAFRLIGLFSLTVGVGAWLAARAVERSADLLRVLLLAKAGGALVLLYYVVRGEFMLWFLLAAIVHDLIWIPVLGWALWSRPKAN